MNQQAAAKGKKCFYRSEIPAYIDGELDSHEELVLEKHLANCQSCAVELNEQKKILCALDFAREIENEIELPENFAKIVATNAESKVSGLRHPQERSKALFACAALFLITLLFFGAETDAVISTFRLFGEQFLAVAGFAFHLTYEFAIGTTVILRALSHQFVFSSTASAAFVFGLLFVSLIALSRLITRFNRS
jgi:anti-sigma factor RsiW